ncbi:hypothetical protein A3D05_05145 [Candidatus Gottesmanbacteria bacterium RIFCSPHIGHO2_02_FULL_40_24]|uniref:Uncharacterized protein n=1 Tax=Candidatus Gottesmanbacteria bacterium RIFCSPHIGHO2_01_FULL_40_15 TaxID=1798376 RepID=A0A1F5Z6U3_9BACT|nr:MAG: hypothetical protein A2777_01780 [Candidatus Gottesmanbacteria bacterium RIFCSPHIGHO2_01_FULL_40_15]OGG16417.1 MAG: hypothetical protein A3D05_05145 [Candidatus Gottesmanbacteria bacterium RIFCSPHIGHO2_02_FULL_40_24]OGG22700.1 MAG: hypothetical protein A3B48_02775 [Candidatus Gottesmanbacteria bacterium RIFCSPLOWO2_01_FULL_40_10]OGG25531.1 MAG: hypothetical protein A3E42_04295 [Candidatus Gottesmanbacteria bacterium RIFCSPHIGHO2_12_FULL_40_13]OGG32540.1 MAG: hypothetical protein A3I80_0
MFKNVIAPVQAWLISQGRCVGCGKSLKSGKRVKEISQEERVTCKYCGRIYLFDVTKRIYRRAPVPVKK